MQMIRRGVSLSVIVMFATALAACGDDVAAGDQECADGQTYNPIQEECVADDGSSDGGSDDGGDDEGGSDDGNGGDDGGDDNGGSDSDDESDVPTGECGPGAIEGQTCRPDGQILAGADLTLTGVDCEDDEPFEMTTEADDQGYYSFYDVPAGDHTLTVESGSFSNEEPVTVVADQTTDLLSDAAKICLEGSSTPIAVISGTYDDVGSLLDGLDIEYDEIGDDGGISLDDFGDFLDDLFGGGLDGSVEDADEFLRDQAQMMTYDIIFIECGSLWDQLEASGDMAAIEDNLRAFVEAGNSVYVSDLAQPFIQKSIPEAVDFYRDGDGTSGPREGTSGQDVTADVLTAEMETLLGSDTTTISYDSPGWAVAEDGGIDSTVHFQGDVATNDGEVEDSALMVIHEAGDGNAIFTSFHNSDQATGEMEEILEFMIFQL